MPPGPEGEGQEGSGSDAIQMGLCGLESEAFRQSLILQAAREIHAPPRPLPTSQTHPSHNAALPLHPEVAGEARGNPRAGLEKNRVGVVRDGCRLEPAQELGGLAAPS